MKRIVGKKAVKKYYDEYYLSDHREYFSDERSDIEVDFLIKNLGYFPQSICDVACGDGRHLLAFQRKKVKNGYGFDNSRELVKSAKNSLSNKSLYVVERESFDSWDPIGDQYDITYSLFSSVYYCLTDKEIISLLIRMSKATKKGGLICLDLDNVFRLIRHLDQKEKANTKEECGFDAEKMWLICKEKQGANLLESQMRYFIAPEIMQFLIQSGIKRKNIRFRGGFDDSLYSIDSKRMIVLAKK